MTEQLDEPTKIILNEANIKPLEKDSTYNKTYYSCHKKLFRRCAKRYYDKNKDKINRVKTINNLNSGVKKSIKNDTLLRYNIKFDKELNKWI